VYFQFEHPRLVSVLSHLRHSQTAPTGTFVRFTPKATFALRCDERSHCANFRHSVHYALLFMTPLLRAAYFPIEFLYG
jgi:hypothetical protein